ncbi:MAG: 4'-phosphopantetheinyl transferase family protein [Blautia sp.]|jgi:4'-phosphopantetheinyl transferase
MKAILYHTVLEEKDYKKAEHVMGEKLLAYGLMEEYGISLDTAQRAVSEYGKPYFVDLPEIHYNISHSGAYVICGFAPVEIGLDVQIHKKVNLEGILERTVPADLARQILDTENTEEAFFRQWVLRESYIKWTGEGLHKDLRTIDMEEGWHTLLSLCQGYSAAIWSECPMEIEWRHVSGEKLK